VLAYGKGQNGMRPIPSGGLRLLVSFLVLFVLNMMLMMTMLPQVAADDYTVTITKVQLTYWCHQYGYPSLFISFFFVGVV
jgi:hypothetical protein